MNEQTAFAAALAALAFGIFLSAVRIALNELSPGTIRKLESANPELAGRFSDWYSSRDRYRISLRLLQVCLVACSTVFWTFWVHTSIGNGAYTWGRTTATVALAVLAYIICGEIAGCGLGPAASRQLLRIGIPLARLLSAPLLPLIWPLELWHRFLSRSHFGGDNGDSQTTTEDEIMSLVEKDEEEQESTVSLEEDERRMIRGIFDLDETLVREIMTPRVDVDAAPVETTLTEVRKLIVESGHSRIPVYRDSVDHIVGIIHAKDLLSVDTPLEKVNLEGLTKPAVFIPESKNVGDLLGEFQENIAHFAVVVDEYGGTAGVVTLEDILEEIVGEIWDEYDRDDEETVSEFSEDGRMVVDARTPICDINDSLDVEIPDDEDFDTIGGYVSFVLGHIPKVGEVVRTDELEVKVLEADERRILKALVGRLSVEEGGAVDDN